MSFTRTDLYRAFGMSRQAYSQHKQRQAKRLVREKQIIAAVQAVRHQQPRLGTRKTHYLLQRQSDAPSIGRDKLFDLLRRENLLIKRRVRRRHTTDSSHGLARATNRIATAPPSAPHQVWVADLTYLETAEGELYLALCMDLYSRCIVGYDVCDSLTADGCLRATAQAIGQLPKSAKAIHHSDHGIQYCCGRFTQLLATHDLQRSMGEVGNCYENAHAERLNGILKDEFRLGDVFASKTDATRAVHQAVQIYNQHRPHLSLNFLTPFHVHSLSFV